MSTSNLVPIKSNEYSTCIFPSCTTPLGHDSKMEGFRTCHEHRACSFCNMPLSASEIAYCHDVSLEKDESLDLKHPRCSAINHPSLNEDPTLSIKQSEYDYLNLIRLCGFPNLDLSVVTNENNAMIYETRLLEAMSFEQKLIHLKMLEACVAQAGLAVRQDSSYRKNALEEREKVHQKRAKNEQLVSSKSPAKSLESALEDPIELAVGLFMQEHDLKERKVAMQLWKEREKSVKLIMSVAKGDSKMEQAIREQVTLEMIKKERLPK
jgi:hypothetical protein